MIYHEKCTGEVAAKSSGKYIVTITATHRLWPQYLAAKESGMLGDPIPAPPAPAPRTVEQSLAELDSRVDARSQELLAAGFAYGGKAFDILTDQERWKEMLLAVNSGLLNPATTAITVYAIDKSTATLSSVNEVLMFCGAYMQKREGVLAAGRVIKSSGRECATVAEIDAIADPR